MNQKNLIMPILMRFAFFALNFYFTIRVFGSSGWNFFSILLAFFATRDFVHAVRLGQVYYHIQNSSKNKPKDK